MRTIELLKAYARVCRMEYIPLEAPGVFVPLFIGATSIEDLLGFHVIEAIVVFMLLFFSGFLINALADLEVDSKYKTFISDSVRVIGEKTMKMLIVAHIAIAWLLTLHLCYIFNNYWLFFWVVVATFFGLAYSVKPFHFKVRGILQFSLMISSLIMVVLLYYVIAGTPPVSVLLVFVFFLIVHHGIELVNQAQDYLEDKESGLLTPAVRWGINRTLIAALVLTLAGLSLGFIGFYILFNDLPAIVIFGFTVSYEVLFIVTVLILIIAYHTPLKGTWDLIKISRNYDTAEQKIALIKKRLNYPRWQLTIVLGVTAISTLFFIWKIV